MTTQQIIELKKPQLKVDIADVLKNRFSPRVFSEEQVKTEDIKKMIEAARWTASSNNRQPWFFYVARKGGQGFEKIFSCLNESNGWAKQVACLVIACYLDEDQKGKNSYAQYDLGQSVMSLVVQAQSLGYYVHEMGGFDKDMAKEVLKIQAPCYPWVTIAIGKIGDYLKTDEILVEKDNKIRQRKENVMIEI